MLAAAVAVVVVLFVVLQPGDDDSTTTPTASSVATTTPGASTEAAAPKPPRPEYVEVRARDLEPVGGIKKIKVGKGDTVRIAVISDQARPLPLQGGHRRDLRARAGERRRADRRAARRALALVPGDAVGQPARA